jgi:hypothetical protein
MPRTGRPTFSTSVILTVTAVIGAWLSACTAPDPFVNPACQQLPAGTVRATVTDLGAVSDGAPRTGSYGTETGNLPATNGNGLSYSCRWPSSSPDRNTPNAFTATVTILAGSNLQMVTYSVMQAHQGPLLHSTAPGQGRAWTQYGLGFATWLCPRRPRDYTSHYLTITVNRPKHPNDPAADAKTLAEAIIPLIGCPPGNTATTSPPTTPVTPSTAATRTP